MLGGAPGRSDGFEWECNDFRSDDRTHPSDQGSDKVAAVLLDWMKKNESSDPEGHKRAFATRKNVLSQATIYWRNAESIANDMLKKGDSEGAIKNCKDAAERIKGIPGLYVAVVNTIERMRDEAGAPAGTEPAGDPKSGG